MPSFIDKHGDQQEVMLSADVYRAAKEANLSVRQYINTQYPTAEEKDTFTQMCASEGLFFKADETTGVNSTPMSHILNPPVKDAATMTRETPVQSRILFPPALMSYIEDSMPMDRKSAVTVFDSMVALTTTVASARTEQPVISYAGNDGPEDTRSQQITQLTEPANMMTITASEVTKQIPTFSMGLMISDQAMQYATIDLVALAIARQKEIELFALAGEALNDMISGDVDNGQSALSVTKADVFDSAVGANDGDLTQKAWIYWLYAAIETRQIDWVIVDSIETAMGIEGRTNRPVITNDDPNSPRIDTLFNMAYPTLSKDVKMFVAPTSWNLPAFYCIGIQSDSAIAKLVNSSADYESSERWALRRGEGFRIDFGQQYYRLWDDAFSIMELTTT